MGLIDVYRINPADQFSVYSPSLKKAQDITYYTLLAKIRGDLNITSTESNIENWNDAYDQTIVAGAVTGYETKTITLTRRDGSTVSFDFQDLNPQDEDTLDMVTTRGNVTVNSIDVGGVTTDYLQFDTAATTTLQPGRMAWNTADGTVDLRLMGDNVTLQIGQESVTRVVNKTGADLLEANYQAVKITGAQGNRLKVGLARADSDPNSADTLGLVTETISDNQEGFVTTSGLIRNVNTTGSLQGETWADGDVLYLSPTTFGRVTNIKPLAPQHTVIMGFVVRAHPTQGQIYVKVDNGYEIDELHNVRITSVANGQFLVYNSSLGVWENQTVSTGGVSGSGTATQVAFWSTSSSLSSDSGLYWDNTLKNLGIGTTSPVERLVVSDNGAMGFEFQPSTGRFYRYDRIGMAYGGMYEEASEYTWSVGPSEKMRLDVSGNLGINTATPSEKIQVVGNVKATDGYFYSSAFSGAFGGYFFGDNNNFSISGGSQEYGINIGIYGNLPIFQILSPSGNTTPNDEVVGINAQWNPFTLPFLFDNERLVVEGTIAATKVKAQELGIRDAFSGGTVLGTWKMDTLNNMLFQIGYSNLNVFRIDIYNRQVQVGNANNGFFGSQFAVNNTGSTNIFSATSTAGSTIFRVTNSKVEVTPDTFDGMDIYGPTYVTGNIYKNGKEIESLMIAYSIALG